MNNNTLDKEREVVITNVKGDPQNKDPITGEPGSHPLGTSLGAAALGTIGAVGGAIIAGPVGAVVGAVVGGAAGGAAGHTVAETNDPTISPVYGNTIRSETFDFQSLDPNLRSDFMSKPYANEPLVDEYQSAYTYGTLVKQEYDRNYPTDYQARSAFETDYGKRDWDDRLEGNLRQGWQNTRNSSRLSFDDAKMAIKDAWHATERAIPGDFDGDGR